MANYKTDDTFLGRVVSYFTTSKLTPLFIGATLVMGLFAVFVTPKEEDPQIVVPMVDIIVPVPGASAKEIEAQIIKPLERIIWQIDDFPVEFLYSMCKPGFAIVTARFYVNSDLQRSLVQLYDKLYSNIDLAPGGGVTLTPGGRTVQPLIKLRDINDVAQVCVTLYSEHYGDYELRRLAESVADELQELPRAAEVSIVGGRNRQVRVLLDPERMAARMTSPLQIAQVIQVANWSMPAGKFHRSDEEYLVEVGPFLESARDVGDLVVGTFQGRPVYLRDVAQIEDGPGEVDHYVLMGVGPRYSDPKEEIGKVVPWPVTNDKVLPAVTIGVAKKKGTNSVNLAHDVEAKLEDLRSQILPDDVEYAFTRDYGHTAGHKANELIFHLLIATVSVILLVGVMLSWRDALVVGIAVPVVLAITLFWSWSIGYTLNRVTLFALIMSIGILVDDPIVDVENIHRHFHMRRLPPIQAIIYAVNEVRPPVILATFTVIVTLLPMAFVGGLMGPYMRPMPVNASAAMLMSLVVALVVTPWCANRFLEHYEPEPVTTRRREEHEEADYTKKTAFYRVYSRVVGGILSHRGYQWLVYLGVAAMMGAAMLLIATKAVLVKLMPFDNKSEINVVIDMPEGTTLEDTTRVALELGEYIRTVNEVVDYQIYAGTSSPFNFNGLVRHYFLRRGGNVADIQVNLVGKKFRENQNHAVAARMRPALHAIADQYGARIKVIEPPPGPPVLDTLVCEIYGEDETVQRDVARQVRDIFDRTQDVVDVDWYDEDDQVKEKIVVDDERVAQHGLTQEMVVKTLRLAMSGMDVSYLRVEGELQPLPINMRFPVVERNSIDDLREIRLPTPSGKLVPLSELVKVESTIEDKPIYHKNLQRVIYVVGDVAGKNESPVYALFNMWKPISEITLPSGETVKQNLFLQPESEEPYTVKWDGEWYITVETFRDMGGAFGIALLVMWVLLVGWFRSFTLPGVIMSPIAFTLVGIMPGHWITGTWFTATSMMGMIALAGIIVRNSILVVQFALERIEEGESLHQACVDAGALRAMPIFLTAAAVFVGGLVILLDPIFNGLATSIIWGTGASTLLSLVMVPVYLYNHLRKEEARNKKRAFKEAKKKAKLKRAADAAARAREATLPPTPPPGEGPVSA
jgi:multidrug efflux pump subunit AcrB